MASFSRSRIILRCCTALKPLTRATTILTSARSGLGAARDFALDDMFFASTVEALGLCLPSQARLIQSAMQQVQSAMPSKRHSSFPSPCSMKSRMLVEGVELGTFVSHAVGLIRPSQLDL